MVIYLWEQPELGGGDAGLVGSACHDLAHAGALGF